MRAVAEGSREIVEHRPKRGVERRQPLQEACPGAELQGPARVVDVAGAHIVGSRRHPARTDLVLAKEPAAHLHVIVACSDQRDLEAFAPDV